MDNRIEVRDTYVSVSYAGAVNCKTLIQDTADQMGVTVSFSYNAEFKDIPEWLQLCWPGKKCADESPRNQRIDVEHQQRRLTGQKAGRYDEPRGV